MASRFAEIKFSVPWNLLLITVGSILFVIGINGIVVHHSFIPGGLYGLCLFIYYKTGFLSPGIIFLLLNIPFYILGWFLISRRFVLYTIYGSTLITIASELIVLDFGIHDQLYAAIAAGCISGAGGGLILRTLGAAGGLDIVAIILHKLYNIGVGKTFLIFNVLLFTMVVANYTADILIASIILTFVTSSCIEYFLTLFNQRKIVYVISDLSSKIAESMVNDLQLGATFIKGRGAYSGRDKEILMAITNNIQLKRMEEKVFSIDPEALFIVENSFDVIGSSFRKRKIY
ncbi:YitT family protein [Desulforhopalus sp. 52FAK]